MWPVVLSRTARCAAIPGVFGSHATAASVRWRSGAPMVRSRVPLLIEFAPGTSLYRERDLPQGLPIVQNGPPGTFIAFQDGLRVSLPTDQIVHVDESGAGARVG